MNRAGALKKKAEIGRTPPSSLGTGDCLRGDSNKLRDLVLEKQSLL